MTALSEFLKSKRNVDGSYPLKVMEALVSTVVLHHGESHSSLVKIKGYDFGCTLSVRAGQEAVASPYQDRAIRDSYPRFLVEGLCSGHEERPEHRSVEASNLEVVPADNLADMLVSATRQSIALTIAAGGGQDQGLYDKCRALLSAMSKIMTAKGHHIHKLGAAPPPGHGWGPRKIILHRPLTEDGDFNLRMGRDGFERLFVREACIKAKGNKSMAGRLLGLSPTAMEYAIRRLNLRWPSKAPFECRGGYVSETGISS